MPNATAAGYTNSFAGTTTTTLYAIDSTTDTLNLQGGINGTPSPNGGTLTSVGALGINAVNTNGFDIQPGANTALAALQVNGETTSKLFSINLSTGAATLVAPIGLLPYIAAALHVRKQTAEERPLDQRLL